MDTLMMILNYMREHPTAVLILTVLILAAIAVLAAFIHDSKKVDAVSAKPLSFTAEQARQVTMQRRSNPTRFVFIIPAKLVKDDSINEWANVITPRLGTGFQVCEVTIIPQKMWFPARYKVTFAKLEALR